jgi:polygalacturonase
MKKMSVLGIAVLLLAVSVTAQDKPLSPPAKAEGKVGSAAITIDYSAPSMRGREIFGGLVPYDKVWRTGANAATTLVTSADITIGDVAVPAGTYTLFTIPGKSEWTLIISSETGQWGSRYNAEKDHGRTTMSVKALDDAVETFVIGVQADALTFTWEKTQASVPVTSK